MYNTVYRFNVFLHMLKFQAKRIPPPAICLRNSTRLSGYLATAFTCSPNFQVKSIPLNFLPKVPSPHIPSVPPAARPPTVLKHFRLRYLDGPASATAARPGQAEKAPNNLSAEENTLVLIEKSLKKVKGSIVGQYCMVSSSLCGVPPVIFYWLCARCWFTAEDGWSG